MTTSKANELKVLMSKEFSSVFELCIFIFENSANVKQTLLLEAMKLYSGFIKWFPLEYVFREDLLSKFLADMKTLNFLRLTTMKCFSEIFGLPIDINKVGAEQYQYIKNLNLNLFKSYILQMQAITSGFNFHEKYEKTDIGKRGAFEDLSMQFALSMISFYKNNFAYIEAFDFQIGTQNGNEMTTNYMSEISKGLVYLTEIHKINNEELFKATCEFWYWFTYKVCFLLDKDFDPESGLPPAVLETQLGGYIAHAQEMYFYRNYYAPILEIVRTTLITKMTKPVEVKIDIDEDGEIVMDPTLNTVYQTLHETMRDTLIILTNLDPINTENIMHGLLQTQVAEQNWNPNLLNSLCWAIGCITGAMEYQHEKRFIVTVIKGLLNLCEMKKGKNNKAIVASNIMYVVGQYPRFLNEHWKFLKTVVKKLFEFMHETHPGVQDFACETFLKISIKCGEQFVMAQNDEHEPYINVLVRGIKEDSHDLQFHQRLMFYEAVGNMIARDPDMKNKGLLIQKMMEPMYSDWTYIFEQANSVPEILLNNVTVKSIDMIVKINERVAMATRTAYWAFGSYIYQNVISTYVHYSNVINDALNSGQVYNQSINVFKGIKKTILRYLAVLISTNDSIEIITGEILTNLASLIEVYRNSHIDNR
jgi:exportin-1